MRSTAGLLRSALVVISPATTTKSVVTSVSQATRLKRSAARQWSRMASLIWSATLSGWPIETDSLVNRYRSLLTGLVLSRGSGGILVVPGNLGEDYKEIFRRGTIPSQGRPGGRAANSAPGPFPRRRAPVRCAGRLLASSWLPPHRDTGPQCSRRSFRAAGGAALPHSHTPVRQHPPP